MALKSEVRELHTSDSSPDVLPHACRVQRFLLPSA